MKWKKTIVLVALISIISTFLAGCNIRGLDYSANYFDNLKKENNARAEGSDIRIMSANILVHMTSWGGRPVRPRAQQFAETLKHYLPDVVGIQEACIYWHSYLPWQIEDIYEMAEPDNNFFLKNRTPILYNKKTLNLLSSELFVYSKKDTSGCRVVTYAVFQKISDGTKFAVTNTHWDLGMEDYKISYRNTQIAELNDIIVGLTKENDIPIFAVGDYNVREKSIEYGAESYKKFLETSKLKDAKFFDNIMTSSGTVSYVAESDDHIFVNQKVVPLSFNILANDFYLKMSDHYPIFVDAKLR